MNENFLITWQGTEDETYYLMLPISEYNNVRSISDKLAARPFSKTSFEDVSKMVDKINGMKKLFLILILSFMPLVVNSQTVKDTIHLSNSSDSIRIENIDNTLRLYGKQSLLSDRITFVQFCVVIVGALLGVPAIPLLIVTSALNLTNVVINIRADRRLSKFRSKSITKHY